MFFKKDSTKLKFNQRNLKNLKSIKIIDFLSDADAQRYLGALQLCSSYKRAVHCLVGQLILQMLLSLKQHLLYLIKAGTVF